MADEYTPTMDDFRDVWVDMRAASIQQVPLAQAEYDRALAVHDESVRQEVRERVAQDIEASILPNDDSPTAHWLRSRAANIARGATRGDAS